MKGGKFEYKKSLLKTYVYYFCLLAVTVVISCFFDKDSVWHYIWIYGVVRLGYLVYLSIRSLMSFSFLDQKVTIFSGPPGASKTFLITVLAVKQGIPAYKRKYREARLLYEQHGNAIKYRAFWKRNKPVSQAKQCQVISIFESWEELKRDNKLPIISNVKITYKGRTSYELTPEHIKGESFVPEGFVEVCDEIGQNLSAIDYANTPKETKDEMRLIRQYHDGMFTGSEQDHNNIDISVRRVVGENVRLETTKHVGRAYLLEFFNKLNLTFGLVKDLFLYRSYGFRKIAYHIEANTESAQNVRIINNSSEDPNEYLFVPAAYVYYDDREHYFESKSNRDHFRKIWGIFPPKKD